VSTVDPRRLGEEMESIVTDLRDQIVAEQRAAAREVEAKLTRSAATAAEHISYVSVVETPTGARLAARGSSLLERATDAILERGVSTGSMDTQIVSSDGMVLSQ
jgi:hypothetical protein